MGTQIVSLFKVLNQLIMSPVSHIASLAKKSDMSSEIGFMGKVRLEILYIVASLRYFSLMLRKNIKVILIIEDISFLELNKVLKVFEVVSLLEEATVHSPFVQILALESIIQPRYTDVKQWPKLPMGMFTYLMRRIKFLMKEETEGLLTKKEEQAMEQAFLKKQREK